MKKNIVAKMIPAQRAALHALASGDTEPIMAHISHLDNAIAKIEDAMSNKPTAWEIGQVAHFAEIVEYMQTALDNHLGFIKKESCYGNNPTSSEPSRVTRKQGLSLSKPRPVAKPDKRTRKKG